MTCRRQRELLLTFWTDFHSHHTSGAEHGSVSDKKSIALWYSGLRSFGRRISGARLVDSVLDFMRMIVIGESLRC